MRAAGRIRAFCNFFELHGSPAPNLMTGDPIALYEKYGVTKPMTVAVGQGEIKVELDEKLPRGEIRINWVQPVKRNVFEDEVK